MRSLSVYINKDKQYNAIEISLSQKVFTLIIILFPIINIYQSGINVDIGIGDAMLLMFLVIYAPGVLKRKLVISDYLLFTIYIISVSFIDIVLINDGVIPAFNLIRIFRHAFFGVIVSVYMPYYFNLQYGTVLMKTWSCVVSVGIVLQSLIYYIFHKLQFFWLPVEAFSGGEIRVERLSHMELLASEGQFRPSFVFVEPAHFSQYVVVGVLLFLFCEKRKSRAFAGAFLCSLGILLSTSAGGIFVMVLGWAVWLLKILKSAIMKRRIGKYIFWFLLFLLTTVMGVLLFTGLGKMMIRRINEIGFNKQTTSGNLRVLRGFLVFFELDTCHQIFGVGLGNIDEYFTKMHMAMPFGSGDYMNSFTYLMNSTGVFGILLLFFVLVRRMFRRNYFLLALSLVVLALTLGESIFNSRSWLVYMAFLLFNRTQVRGILNKNEKYY